MDGCGICGESLSPETEDSGVCSGCGFMVERATALGFALAPALPRGAGCESCSHSVVCRVFEAASSVGAYVYACPERVESEDRVAPEPSEPDEEAPLLDFCSRCPYNEKIGPLPGCVPQTARQRLSFCGALAKHSASVGG